MENLEKEKRQLIIPKVSYKKNQDTFPCFKNAPMKSHFIAISIFGGMDFGETRLPNIASVSGLPNLGFTPIAETGNEILPVTSVDKHS